MIAIRRAESDADLEAWRTVRLAVIPGERAPSVAEIRQGPADRLHLLAHVDGALAGSGLAGRSDLADFGFLVPRVLPEARRRGVGTALLRRLAAHLEDNGYTRVSAWVDDPSSLEFAQRVGFRYVDAQVQQIRAVGDEPAPLRIDGIAIVSLAERPELWRAAYDSIGRQALEDMPAAVPLRVTAEQWEAEWASWPEGSFVALADGEVVGCAGLLRDEDKPSRAEHSLTAVRREWRRRGLGTALKRTTLAWAAENGIHELYTWTHRGNEGMRRLNERLGYLTRSESVNVHATLPLP